jgi:hypothetical protein
MACLFSMPRGVMTSIMVVIDRRRLVSLYGSVWDLGRKIRRNNHSYWMMYERGEISPNARIWNKTRSGCDDACWYHCTMNGQVPPMCIINKD